MKRFCLVCASLCLMLLVASVAFASESDKSPAEDSLPDPDAVLATVEGSEIRLKDVNGVISRLDPQRAAMYDNEMGRRAILEELVNVELFALLGDELEVEKDPEFIDMMSRIRKDIVRQFAVDAIIKDVSVSDEEVAAEYEEKKDNFKIPVSVRASHILVEDEEAMEKVLKDLDGGMSFDEAARKHSTCPSKEQGGDLGFFVEGQMVKEFSDAAFAMKVGEVTKEPVKTQFGLHLIKLVERKEESIRPFDEVKAQLADSMLNDKQSEAYQGELKRLREKYEVVVIEDEKKEDESGEEEKN
ncbi:MAG: peptidylprolyl isomerase [Synergistaceae bacterium]|nr:peptidylprolyl isomerase [Synergistota bacterium]NLM72085.1 peptidylprolyl isomerase [Synergistaceae bacterium]